MINSKDVSVHDLASSVIAPIVRTLQEKSRLLLTHNAAKLKTI